MLLTEPQTFRSLLETVSLEAPIQESHFDSAAHLSLAVASKFRKRMFYNLPQLSFRLAHCLSPLQARPSGNAGSGEETRLGAVLLGSYTPSA